MLYTISINQKAALDSGLPLNFQHLAVVAVLKNMFASSDTLEVWHDGRCFKWVALQTIADELPLLDLEKRRISGLISELEDMAIVERHPENKALRKSFFRASKNWNMLFTTMQKIAEPSMQKIAEYTAKNCIDTTQKIAYDHSTNNHSTIYKEKEEIFSFSENNLPDAVKEIRVNILPYQDFASLPFPSHIEKARPEWANFLKACKGIGKPIKTAQQAEALIKTLAGYSNTDSDAIASITYSIAGGYPNFYDRRASATQPKANSPQSQVRGRTGSNFDGYPK
jgi:hypothetical protein